LTFFDYMFLRRVNNALTHCSENYLVIPVFLIFISQIYIVHLLSLPQELRKFTLLMKESCSKLQLFYLMGMKTDKTDFWQFHNSSDWLIFTTFLMTIKFHLMKGLSINKIFSELHKIKCFLYLTHQIWLIKSLLILKD